MVSLRTRLDVVNEILLAVNEPTVVASTGADLPIAVQKAIKCLEQAFRDIQNSGRWSWNKVRTNFDSWSTHTATLIGASEIIQVEWVSTTGHTLVIPTVEKNDFFTTLGTPVPYTSTSTTPTYCCYSGDSVLLSPYPNDSTTRNQLFVWATQYQLIPLSDMNPFSCDEQALDAVKMKACQHMANQHLADGRLASSFYAEYDRILGRLQSMKRDTSAPMRIR